MKGLYLYCLRKKNPALIRAVKTIDKGKVFTLPYKELEAVVSAVDLKEFSSEEIQKKAQEDLNWIKEKAQIHEHVIEQAMGKGGKIIPVIPMKFGTIFKTKESLEEMTSKRYAKFKKSLANLEDKQEWGIKVYLNEEVFENALKTPRMVTRPARRSLGAGGRGSSEVKGLASLPKGMDFFAKKQVEKVIKKEKNRKLGGVLQKVFENLQKLAVEASQGKNLDKALTGREEPMVLNLNLLIKEEKVKEFQQGVNKLKADYQNSGLIIQESGPWPPYNFVKI